MSSGNYQQSVYPAVTDGNYTLHVTIANPVPEPSTALLFGIGIITLLIIMGKPPAELGGYPLLLVEMVINNPDGVLGGKNNRKIYQKIDGFKLIRVVSEGNKLLTVYKTDKIKKYSGVK